MIITQTELSEAILSDDSWIDSGLTITEQREIEAKMTDILWCSEIENELENY